MKRKRKTQAERREETRKLVLAAAAGVFAKRGFHATSLDAVAGEAGFSRGAVYYNSADKDELFLELLDRRCAERAQDLRTALDEVVAERTRPVSGTLGMEPEQLDVVIDSLGTGLSAHHMLHGPQAVPPDLFSKALALLVDGIAERAGAVPQPQEA